MSFDQEQSHVLSLHDAVVEIKATLNNGLEAQLLEQNAELKSVKDDVQLIRDALIGPRPARRADARRLPGHAGSGEGVWR